LVIVGEPILSITTLRLGPSVIFNASLLADAVQYC
jgi:hypothetical protein